MGAHHTSLRYLRTRSVVLSPLALLIVPCFALHSWESCVRILLGYYVRLCSSIERLRPFLPSLVRSCTDDAADAVAERQPGKSFGLAFVLPGRQARSHVR